MNTTIAIAILSLAALLEAGGDALIRSGIHATGTARYAWMATGALVLFCYGYLVNAPAWDFGKLIGIYVVLFFLAAQVISWLAFHQRPSGAVLAGGALIVAGGVVITVLGN